MWHENKTLHVFPSGKENGLEHIRHKHPKYVLKYETGVTKWNKLEWKPLWYVFATTNSYNCGLHVNEWVSTSKNKV